MAVHRGRGSVRTAVTRRVIPDSTRGRPAARVRTRTTAVAGVAGIRCGQSDATVAGQSFLKSVRADSDSKLVTHSLSGFQMTS